MGRSSSKRFWLIRLVSLLAVLSAILLLFFVFELYARWHYRDVLSTSHGRDYFYYKSRPLIKAEKNNIGYRGGNVQGLHEGVYRIVVLGDSLAWGQGIYPYTRRFPELAEKFFKERYPGLDIEVVNLGVPGLDLKQYNQLLPFVVQLQPDFVLYEWYVNDMEEQVNVGKFHAFTLIPNQRWHNYGMDHFVTYILLYRTWNQLRTSLGLQQSYPRYLKDRLGDPGSTASLWAQKALHELITTLQGKGIAVGIALFPLCRSDMGAYELDFLHERVLDECRRDKITCLDLRKAFSAFAGRMKELQASSLDGHPSKVAHRIAAEQIVRTFGPMWRDESAKRSDNGQLSSGRRG